MCNKNKGIAFTLHNTYPKWQQHFTEHFPHALQSISRIRTSILQNPARPPQGPEGAQSPRSWAGRLWKMKGCWPQETTELLRKENCGKQTDKTPVKHIFSSDKNSVHLPFQVHGRLASSREVASFLPFFFFQSTYSKLDNYWRLMSWGWTWASAPQVLTSPIHIPMGNRFLKRRSA